MLTILFKILSILGILLLILLGIALVVILLVLFFPVCYKMSGKKTAEEMLFDAKMKWLFGLVRVSYSYPVPGKLLAKVLFFTVYDSSDERKEKKHVSTGKSSKKAVVPPTTEIPQEEAETLPLKNPDILYESKMAEDIITAFPDISEKEDWYGDYQLVEYVRPHFGFQPNPDKSQRQRILDIQKQTIISLNENSIKRFGPGTSELPYQPGSRCISLL